MSNAPDNHAQRHRASRDVAAHRAVLRDTPSNLALAKTCDIFFEPDEKETNG